MLHCKESSRTALILHVSIICEAHACPGVKLPVVFLQLLYAALFHGLSRYAQAHLLNSRLVVWHSPLTACYVQMQYCACWYLIQLQTAKQSTCRLFTSWSIASAAQQACHNPAAPHSIALARLLAGKAAARLHTLHHRITKSGASMLWLYDSW